METKPLTEPFSAEAIEEIQLADAPLVRVLAQVRFPRLAALENQNIIRNLTSHLAEKYPIFEEAHEVSLLVNSEGVAQQPQKAPIWRFRGADEIWTVTVAPNFLAIETSLYDGRKAFIDRFKWILEAFYDVVHPPFAERVGVRYTNRVNRSDLVEDIERLIEPGALGGLAIPIGADVVRNHALCDALFHIGDRSLQVRWGLLPERAVLDPTLPPVEEKSWILDLDSFTQNKSDFATDHLIERTQELAEQAYRMFRWIVTERFIETFRVAR